MKNSSKFAFLGFFLFTFFLVFSFLVSLDTFSAIDFQTTIRIQQILPDFVITPFSVFSILGSAEIASLFLLSLFILISNLRNLYVLFLYGIAGVIEIIGKSIISQSGPPIEFLKTNLHFGFPSGGISGDFFSYPSGHLARTIFISTVLLFAIWKSPIKKELKIGFAICVLSFDILMFVSRVYLGEHWLSDVVGGILLGVSLGILASAFIFAKTKRGKLN